MEFSNEVGKRFPLCAQFLKTEVQPKSLKANKPRVWNAFLKASERQAWALKAIEWGNPEGPLIIPRPGLIVMKEMCGLTRAPRFSTDIEIDELLLEATEQNPVGVDRDFCRRHLEATILHELVHWARFQAGVNDKLWAEPPIDFGDGEAGSVFETWAYGKVFCTSADYARLVLSCRV